MKPECEDCGAAVRLRVEDSNEVMYECGTYSSDVPLNHPQTDKCRITQLEAENVRLRARVKQLEADNERLLAIVDKAIAWREAFTYSGFSYPHEPAEKALHDAVVTEEQTRMAAALKVKEAAEPGSES